jgi:hypothetical protein
MFPWPNEIELHAAPIGPILKRSRHEFGAVIDGAVGRELPARFQLPGDYDGDGLTDPAVYRPSTGEWFVLYSSTNYTSSAVENWGLDTDVPVPGDYDGDRRTDLARPNPRALKRSIVCPYRPRLKCVTLDNLRARSSAG